MKKIIILVFLATSVILGNAQTVTTVITTNGIAPIPAFALNKPAALVFFNTNLTKNLELSPDATFELPNGKGWFNDIWLKWNQPLDSAKRWIATIGADWSFIFQGYKTPAGNMIIQTVRYPTFEGKLKFLQNRTSTFTFDIWYTWPIEKDYGVKGTYIDLTYSYTKDLHKFSFTTDPSIFYLNYTDGTKGFCSAIDAKITYMPLGIFFGGEVIQPINAAKFNWNLSAGFTVKLK